MAEFPNAIATLRALVNRAGAVYDVTKTKVFYAEDHNLMIDEVIAIENTLGINPEGAYTTVALRLASIVVPVKATGAEVNTGTNDAKFVTAKAVADSNIAFLADIPTLPVKASGAEIDTGTNDAKFVTPKALSDSTKIEDSNNNEVIVKGSVGSAVNEITVTNAVTGASPQIEASGGDGNIGLKIKGKGNGAVDFNKTVSDLSAPAIKFQGGNPGVAGVEMSFVNLGATPVNCFGGSVVGTAMLFCSLTNIDGDTATFQINSAIEAGVTWKFNHIAGANCAITESSEGVFAITGLGDGRTYTITLSTGASQMTIKSSTTATGTTYLRVFALRMVI